MRGFGVVFTPPVAYKGIAIACKGNTLTLGKRRKNHCSSQFHACHHFSDDFHHDEDELDEAAEGYPLHRVLEVDSFSSSIVPSEWLTWSLSNLLTGMESCVTFARLFISRSLIWMASW